MQLLLFKDSEVFIKNRPEELTENQKNDIWKELAKYIINEKWSNSDINDILNDLKKIPLSYSGYEKAKQLESSKRCYYDLNTFFIEWLDSIEINFQDRINENVSYWVKVHDIKPIYNIGTELAITSFINNFQIGEKIFINGIYEKLAKYLVSDIKDSKRNIAINYEEIEKCCSVNF